MVLTPQAKQPSGGQGRRPSLWRAPPRRTTPCRKSATPWSILRTIQHLRPRTNLFSAAFRVRSVAAHAIHCFFQDRGFVYVHTPIITASDCEGAGEMFQVTTLDLNNVAHRPRTAPWTTPRTSSASGPASPSPASSTAENFAMAFGNVYTFGPTFRAENSNTQRHAAEFWMIEPEMAFADLNDYMDTAEAMIKYIIRTVMEKCPEEMNFFNSFVDKGLHGAAGARGLLRLRPGELHRGGGASEAEQRQIRLSRWTGAATSRPSTSAISPSRSSSSPVFVTDYPKEIKAFYMRLNDDGKTVAAADCLVPGIGEIIGGSQREERLDVLETRMQELGLKPEDYWWYCDLRRYGSCRARRLRPGLRADGHVPHRHQQYPGRGAAPRERWATRNSDRPVLTGTAPAGAVPSFLSGAF